MFYRLTPSKLIQLAFEFTVSNKLRHNFSVETKTCRQHGSLAWTSRISSAASGSEDLDSCEACKQTSYMINLSRPSVDNIDQVKVLFLILISSFKLKYKSFVILCRYLLNKIIVFVLHYLTFVFGAHVWRRHAEIEQISSPLNFQISPISSRCTF